MKKYYINELANIATTDLQDGQVFDLSNQKVKNCLGCWTCWWKTPGRCVHQDLESFYFSYINSDQVIFFAKLNKGMVSVNMKALLDRMIPLFLPYTVFRDGGTYHVPRYPRYPDIVFCYDYDFEDENEFKIFEDYLVKVFDQFYSKDLKIYSVDEYRKAGV